MLFLRAAFGIPAALKVSEGLTRWPFFLERLFYIRALTNFLFPVVAVVVPVIILVVVAFSLKADQDC